MRSAFWPAPPRYGGPGHLDCLFALVRVFPDRRKVGKQIQRDRVAASYARRPDDHVGAIMIGYSFCLIIIAESIRPCRPAIAKSCEIIIDVEHD